MKKIMAFFLWITGTTYRRKQRRLREQIRKIAEEYIRRRVLAEKKNRLENYPLVKLTPEELAKLPKSTELDFKDLHYGTWFVYGPQPDFPEVILLGHVVPVHEINIQQLGACMSPPDPYVNCYRLELV